MVSYLILIFLSLQLYYVLILIVVDNGLVQISVGKNGTVNHVLILVVMDNGLVHGLSKVNAKSLEKS